MLIACFLIIDGLLDLWSMMVPIRKWFLSLLDFCERKEITNLMFGQAIRSRYQFHTCTTWSCWQFHMVSGHIGLLIDSPKIFASKRWCHQNWCFSFVDGKIFRTNSRLGKMIHGLLSNWECLLTNPSRGYHKYLHLMVLTPTNPILLYHTIILIVFGLAITLLSMQ